MINEEKAMTDAINAITRLNFRQLCTLQASLSEHILNCLLHSYAKKETERPEVEPSLN